ncbi:phage tail tape measure protein [Serratia fonticola]|uniref:phage tail tape measure protein n=1 Tax=Serratia fonticola TaxID=47917 RepID=UPI002178E08F|nr:phage tail tape measure protein [Serratia fonticola]CAI1513759.1 Phage-related minor tail protein [Serratia fonticola]
MADITTMTLRVNASDLQRANRDLVDLQSNISVATGRFEMLNRTLRSGMQEISRYSNIGRQLSQLGDSTNAFIINLRRSTAAIEEYRQALEGMQGQASNTASVSGSTSGDFGWKEALDQGSQLVDIYEGVEKIITPLGKMGPLIAVAVGTTALLGTAYYQGAKEAEEFNKQLILTGDYAGKSSSQLQEMAKAISGDGITQHTAAGILAQVVGSGSFNASQLETVAKAAAAMQEATGQSVDVTINNFQRLYDSPTKSSVELNKQMHYLTSSQYEYISSLEKRGYKEEAGEAAAKVYSEAEQQRSRKILDNLGLIERAIKAVNDAKNSMWDALQNIGRPVSMENKLAELQSEYDNFQKTLLPERETLPSYGFTNAIDGGQLYGGYDQQRKEQLNKSDSLKTQIDGLKRIIFFTDIMTTAIEKGNQADAARTESLHYQNGVLSKNLSWQQKRNAALTELWRMVAKAPKDWSDEDRKKAVDQINADNKPSVAIISPKYYDEQPVSILKQEQERLDLLNDENHALMIQDNKLVSLTEGGKRLAMLDREINHLRGENRLSLQEQSILKGKEALRTAILETEQQEKFNQEKRQGLELELNMAQYARTVKNRSVQELGKYGLSNREQSRFDERNQLKNAFIEGGGKFGIDDKATGPGAEKYNIARDTQDQFYVEDDKKRGDWLLGAQKGWNEYLDSATNVYDSMANIGQATFSGLSDMLTSMVTTGKANFQEFTASILKMIIQVINQLLVAFVMQKAMGWIGGAFTPAATGKSSGGYTGDGGKYDQAGVVHRGEFVMTKEATQRIGVGNLYAMMRGYADGGLVGGNKAPMYGLAAEQGGGITVNSTVVMNNDGSANAANSSSAGDGMGKLVQGIVNQAITERLGKELKPGGLIWNASAAR